MKFLRTYGTGLLGIFLIFGLVGFAEKNHADRQVAGIRVHVNPVEGGLFITSQEVLETMNVEKDSLRGFYTDEINISLLEEMLEGHASVKQAEVYFQMDGTLMAEVDQRRPILRFFDGNLSYYWDEDGEVTPLSKHFTARVPLFFGPEPDRKSLLKLVSALRSDEFFSTQITGIALEDNDFILTTRFGNHQIILGELEDLSEKLSRLKLFYQKTQAELGWESYRTLNLKYANQVVCTTN